MDRSRVTGGATVKDLLNECPVTMPDMFKATVTRSPRHVALRWKEDGQWKDMSYSQYYRECISAAKAFIKVQRICI